MKEVIGMGAGDDKKCYNCTWFRAWGYSSKGTCNIHKKEVSKDMSCQSFKKK